jgi:hypothetical protein
MILKGLLGLPSDTLPEIPHLIHPGNSQFEDCLSSGNAGGLEGNVDWRETAHEQNRPLHRLSLRDTHDDCHVSGYAQRQK